MTLPPTLTLATQAPGEPEIFASLQGEGPSAGMPVAFMRLSRCNLACTWCDTPYTWRFSGEQAFDRKAEQVTLELPDIAQRILALGQNRLVITGGEPMLQAGRLAQLLELLPDMRVEIETNGTVLPPAQLDVRVDQYNVSPKLAHSGNPAALALIPAMLDHWASEPRAFLKFVVAAPDDVDQVLSLARTHAIPAQRTFLMAEGTDSETLRQRDKWLAPLCLAHGLRLSDRLHIHLYGDTRGT
jgi:7-carboxy-7-deazaguanine synthase